MTAQFIPLDSLETPALLPFSGPSGTIWGYGNTVSNYALPLTNGNVLKFYYSNNSPNETYDLHMQLYDPTGAAVGNDVVIGTVSATNGNILIGSYIVATQLSETQVAVTWTSADSGIVGYDHEGDPIQSTISDQPASARVVNFENGSFSTPVLTAPTVTAVGATVVAMPNGSFLWTWQDNPANYTTQLSDPPALPTSSTPPIYVAAESRLFSEIVSADGTVTPAFSPAVPDPTNTNTNLQGVSVTGLVGGGAVMAWADSTAVPVDQGYSLPEYGEQFYDQQTFNGHIQVLDSSGQPVGPQLNINNIAGYDSNLSVYLDQTYNTGANGFITVLALSTGGFVATWENPNEVTPTGANPLQSIIFDATGNEVATIPYSLNESPVYALSNGQFIAMRLDSNNNPILDIYDDHGNLLLEEQSPVPMGSSFYQLADGRVYAEYTTSPGGNGTLITNGQMFDPRTQGITLTGTSQSDYYVGTPYNDIISGGSGGNDKIYGGAGNDTIIASATGNDILDGGTGNNTVSFQLAQAGVTVDLTLTTPQNTVGAGIDTLLNFNSLIGSAFDDTIVASGNGTINGGAGNDTIIASVTGNDTLDGGPGNNTVSFQLAHAGVTVDLSLATPQNTVGAGTDTLLNFNSLIGSAFDDTIKAGAGNDIIVGGKGNDSITCGAGQDYIGFSPGDGADTIAQFRAGSILSDVIVLGGSYSSLTFAQLLGDAEQVGADTVLTLGPGDSITFLNVLKTDLVSQNFGLGNTENNIVWKKAVDGDFSTDTNWNPAQVPVATDNVIISPTGNSYFVTSVVNETVNTLTTVANATLDVANASTFTITNGTGTDANAGRIAVGDGATLVIGGTFNNTGAISLNSTNSSTVLQIIGSVILSSNGSLANDGKITLSDNTNNAILSNGSVATLTSSDIISGAGTIGDAHLTLNNQATGVIEANTPTGIDLKANVNNDGLIEALGTAASLKIDGATITSLFQLGELLASGAGAHIDIGGTIVGGVLKATGPSAQFNVVPGSQAELDGSGSPVTNTANIAADKGSNLILKGTISNTGTIALGAAGGAGNHLEVLGAVILSGAGAVKISDNANNGIIADGSGTLTNVDNTISGSGTIGDGNVTLDNQAKGVINGNSDTTTLTLNTGNNLISNEGTIEGTTLKGITIASNVTNANLLEALGTNAFMTIEGTVFNVSSMSGELGSIATGTILASGDGAHVVLGGGTTVVGGILKSAGSASSPGYIEVSSNATIDGSAANMPVFISGTLEVIDAATLTLKGTINNSGSLLLQSIGDATQLRIVSEVDLNSMDPYGKTTPGKITLTDNANNSIVSDGNPASLINTGNTISGAGTIGDSKLTIDNQSTAVINGSGVINTLIFSAAANSSNEGTLEGTTSAGIDIKSNISNSSLIEALGASARLHIEGATVTNTKTGVILASGTNAHVDLDGATIAGGTLKTTGTGAMMHVIGTNLSTLDGSGAGLPINNTGAVAVNDAASLAMKGTINNTGSIALSSTGNVTNIDIVGAVTLNGTGKITMSTNVNNSILSNGATATLTNNGNTISGAGTIGDAFLTVTNGAKGIIDGNTATGLTIVSNVNNSNLIEALGTSARLHIEGATVTNTKTGVILASGTNAHVDLDGATIAGGTLKTTGTGAMMHVIGTNLSTLDGSGAGLPINNTGAVAVNDAASLAMKGTINNTGSIALSSTGNVTNIDIVGAVTLNGTGKITMSTNVNNSILSNGATATLTNNGNTISGAGTIGDAFLTVTNGAKGIIDGNTATGLTIVSNVNNSNLIEALGTSAKVIIEDTITNTTAGKLLASGTGANIELDNATIKGGTLATTGTGALIETKSGTSNVFDGSTAAGAVNVTGSLLVSNDTALVFDGKINNTGTITLAGTTDATDIVIRGLVVLSGAGHLTLTNNAENLIESDGAPATLTNVANTISGAGSINDSHLTLDNQAKGVIDAVGTNSLTIDVGAFTNEGKLEATGDLVIENTTITNSATASLVTLAATAHIDLDNAIINGGIVTMFTGSTIDTLNGGDSIITIAKLANKGMLEADDGNLTINAVLANSGVLAAANNSHLDITGAVTGTGTGTIANGGTLEFYAASSVKVTFLVGTGTLQLDNSSTAASKFSGTVSGWANGDAIDFTDINFGGSSFQYTENATHSGGTLLVTDGTHTSSITIVGAALSTHFQLNGDNNGHVELLWA